MITNHDRKIEELRRQLEEAEAERAAEAKREAARLKRAQKVAGESHSRVVLGLYELLGIEPEHGTTRVVNGVQRRVAVDRDERTRAQRLYDLVAALVVRADPSVLDDLKRADEHGRDERRPRPKEHHEPAPEPSNDSTSPHDASPTPHAHPQSA